MGDRVVPPDSKYGRTDHALGPVDHRLNPGPLGLHFGMGRSKPLVLVPVLGITQIPSQTVGE